MTTLYTIELDGKALHHYGKGVYGWGKYSSTAEIIGVLVEWETESEAAEWMAKRRVFCSGAVIKTKTKRGPGRPKTGAALTPAEKQKRYRERLKERAEEEKGGLKLTDAERTALISMMQDKARHLYLKAEGKKENEQLLVSAKWCSDLAKKIADFR